MDIGFAQSTSPLPKCRPLLAPARRATGRVWGLRQCSARLCLSHPRPLGCSTLQSIVAIGFVSSPARPAPLATTAPQGCLCAALRAPTAPSPPSTPRSARRAHLAAQRASPCQSARARAPPRPATTAPRDPPRPLLSFAPLTFGVSAGGRPRCGARNAMATLACAPPWAPLMIPVSAWWMVICCATGAFKGATLASYRTSHLIEKARSRFTCIPDILSLISLIAALIMAVWWRTIRLGAAAPFLLQTTTLT
jgi:hypothetical protein